MECELNIVKILEKNEEPILCGLFLMLSTLNYLQRFY
jgi:hypothetical protein